MKYFKMSLLYLNKPCPAGVTAVRLLSRVDARVSLQVGWTVKLGSTYITTIWPITWEDKIYSQ